MRNKYVGSGSQRREKLGYPPRRGPSLTSSLRPASISLFLTLLFLLLSVTALTAEKYATRRVEFSDYIATVRYNETVNPGDAVFAKLELFPKSSKSRKKIGLSTAKIEFYEIESEKKLSGSKMYFFTPKTSFFSPKKLLSKKPISDVLFSGIPLSSYLKPKDYNLKIIFSAFENAEKEMNVPVKIEKKDFIEETIPLNSKNTAIKTDSSKERTQQINKLNEILDTADYSAVFQKKAFSYPTTATRRTSFFADRRTFAYSNGTKSTGLHFGIDYGIPTGTDVTSCAAGLVVLAEWRNSTGYSIVIEHLPNLYSLYYHLDKMLVKEGDFVEGGKLIGKSGATGLATGPHLHWEIRLKMEAVNPDFFVENFDWE